MAEKTTLGRQMEENGKERDTELEPVWDPKSFKSRPGPIFVSQCRRVLAVPVQGSVLYGFCGPWNLHNRETAAE